MSSLTSLFEGVDALVADIDGRRVEVFLVRDYDLDPHGLTYVSGAELWGLARPVGTFEVWFVSSIRPPAVCRAILRRRLPYKTLEYMLAEDEAVRFLEHYCGFRLTYRDVADWRREGF